MKSLLLPIISVGIFVFASAARAEIKVVIEHNIGENATSRFKFKNVPAPSRGDAATRAKFTIVDGQRDQNGGDLDQLHDVKVPSESDQPAANFFFRAGSAGGCLMIDLGSAIEVKQVNTYSWHADARAPQVYNLFASDGKSDEFKTELKNGADRGKAG